jgi:hypothetical protein
MPRVRIDKWPVTGLAKGSLNGKPFALPVGRVVETTDAIAEVLKQVQGAKVKVFKADEAEAVAAPQPVTVLHPKEEKQPEPAADPKPDDPPAEDEKPKDEPKAPKPRASKKAAAKKK